MRVIGSDIMLMPTCETIHEQVSDETKTQKNTSCSARGGAAVADGVNESISTFLLILDAAISSLKRFSVCSISRCLLIPRMTDMHRKASFLQLITPCSVAALMLSVPEVR